MAVFNFWDRDPFYGIQRLQNELERVFERPFGDLGLSGRGAHPPVNVFREDQGLVVRLEVPGFAPEDLNIEARNQRLVISGKRAAAERTGASFHRRERWSGEFSRALQIPREYELERAEAGCQDGVLTVRVPLREEVKPRQIEVVAH